MKTDPLGHPMWFPEPCSQFGEVHLGDVGYIIKGEFVFLFNAIERDHPRNIRGVPSDPFDPPPMSEKRQPYSIAPGSERAAYTGHCVASAQQPGGNAMPGKHRSARGKQNPKR